MVVGMVGYYYMVVGIVAFLDIVDFLRLGICFVSYPFIFFILLILLILFCFRAWVGAENIIVFLVGVIRYIKNLERMRYL